MTATPSPPSTGNGDGKGVVVVVTGGDPLGDHAPPEGIDGAVVVAADSGVDRAFEAGLPVHHAVGDFDSVSRHGLDRAAAARAELHVHPSMKDATDLELALDLALTFHPGEVLVLGGHGGRLDHFWANLELLASAPYAGVTVRAWMGAARVTIVRPVAAGATHLTGTAEDLVSLLPLHGPALGVTTEDLLYPLRDEDLAAGSTRGVSNRFLASHAAVVLTAGVLAAIQPGTPDEERP